MRTVDVCIGHDDDLVVARLVILKSPPSPALVVTPQPIAVISDWMVSLENARWSPTRSTFRILPRRGRIAWMVSATAVLGRTACRVALYG